MDRIELRHERSPHPWLGVELRATTPQQAGVTIENVRAGSPAEKAGLSAGDVLLALDGEPVLSPVNVQQFIRSKQPGASIALAVQRGQSQHLLRAELEGIPDFEDQLRLAFVGRAAPDIHGVISFQGDVASLQELEGQVVILEFWASFCGVCRVLAPTLDQWQRTFAPQGAQVLGITVDPPSVGLRVARSVGMSYALASDPQQEITRRYLASQIPTVIIIDKRGIVRDAMVGYSKERIAETKALISALLQEDS